MAQRTMFSGWGPRNKGNHHGTVRSALECMRLNSRGKCRLARVALQSDLSAMSTLLNNSVHWHLRAEEARVLAQHFADPIAKASIDKLAEEYDRLAVRAAVRTQDRVDESKTG